MQLTCHVNHGFVSLLNVRIFFVRNRSVGEEFSKQKVVFEYTLHLNGEEIAEAEAATVGLLKYKGIALAVKMNGRETIVCDSKQPRNLFK